MGVAKGILMNFNDPNGDQLKFQYNPTNITDSKTANWSSAAIPGGNDSLATFGNGSNLQLQMQLLFNVYGEGERTKDIHKGSRRYVEDAINFLYRHTEVQPASAAAGPARPGQAPDILLLSLGAVVFPGSFSGGNGINTNFPVLPVRLERISVKRLIFSKKDYTTLRATADITLTRHAGFPR